MIVIDKMKEKINKFVIKLFGLSGVRTDSVGIKGIFNLKVIRNGKVLSDSGWIKNIVTNAGKAALAGLAGNTGGVTAFTYLAVGTSTTTPAATDTTLGAELSTLSLGRAAATVSRVTTTTTNDTLQLTYTWTASGGTTVQEIGQFNAASTGTMLGHALTGARTLISGDQLVGTYQTIFS